MLPEPLVTFWQLVPGGVAPRRASTDVDGTLPSHGLRYCEPVKAASAYGYHLYLPLDIGIVWDGADSVQWSYDHDGNGIRDWWPLVPNAGFPEFNEVWNAGVPPALRGACPALIALGEDHGLLQIWTGCIARTRADWSLLVRGPVNDPRRSLGYEVLEGIVATDRWGGHLFANLRLLANKPILLLRNRPLLQVVPVHRRHYGDLLNDFAVGDLSTVPEDRWHSYQELIVDRPAQRPLGDYAICERKRRAAEVADV